MATIILAGVPGSMCREIAEVARDDKWRNHHQIAQIAVGSPRRQGQEIDIMEGCSVRLLTVEALPEAIREAGIQDPIVVDYTTPDTALANIGAYCSAGIPFVMGTTGFDAGEARRLVAASSVNAVISPNMAVPIILLQNVLGRLAREFQGALEGWSLAIRESHQTTKKDVSGTARAILPHLEALGAKPADPPISVIREEKTQRELGVPDGAIGGHGWHWYELKSPDHSVSVDFSHRINGRKVYAEGTLLAVDFLARHQSTPQNGYAFTMEDVLGAAQTT
ncbi:MAG: hypothetical protein JJU11_15425 [Candidatus Sumerlaeia bacterium]|nr:hypothetical protein [Candidatus Sumerlaeia bacterium]